LRHLQSGLAPKVDKTNRKNRKERKNRQKKVSRGVSPRTAFLSSRPCRLTLHSMIHARRSEVPPRERPVSPPRRSRRPRPSPLDELEPSKPDGIWEQDGLTTRRWIARSLLLLAKRDASVGDVRYLDMGDLFYLSHDDYSHLSSFPPRGFGGTVWLSSQSKLLGFAVVLIRSQRDGGECREATRQGRCRRREDKVER
jgi:hypothetical protein